MMSQREDDIPRSEEWGPFVRNLDECERKARLRSLRAITRLLLGPHGDVLERAILCAEQGHVSLRTVLDAINRLPSWDRRRVLGSFGGLMKAQAPCAAE